MPEGAASGGALEFLEAAYSWELPEEKWLGKLATAVARVWGSPRWVCGFSYDASDLSRFNFTAPVLIGGSAQLRDFLVEGMSRMTPEMLMRTFRSRQPMGFGRSLGGADGESEMMLARAGTVDTFGLNGLDTSGKGCFVGIGAERKTLTASEILVFQRLAFHLASAYRIRRRLREQAQDPLDNWEALVDLNGYLLEARGAAEPEEEQEALGRAARAMLQVRRRRAGSGDPTSGWRPRIAGRWTLVDAFSRRGQRFIVARENEAPAPGLEALTNREQQVVASAISGRSNKEIAYDLGISSNTARVLLSRACARLGVRSKKELLELPRIKALRGVLPERPPPV